MKIRFDVAAVNLAMARAYSYEYYLDNDTNGVSLTGVVVSENSDGSFSCVAPLPTSILKPTTTVNGVVTAVKSHTIQVAVSNNVGKSSKSSTLTVDTDGPLPAPVNLRLEDTLKVPTVVAPSVTPHSLTSVSGSNAGTGQTLTGQEPSGVNPSGVNPPSQIPSSYPNPNPTVV